MPLQIVATDSQSGRTLNYSASGLPPGLSINNTGLISGTPSAVGSYNVTVTVTDNVGVQGQAFFPWAITSIPLGKKGTVGASAITPAYGTGYTTQVATFDSYVGRPLAITSWKTYFSNVSQYPVTINNPQPIGTAAALGAKVLVSFKPAVDPTGRYTSNTYATEAVNLGNAVKLFVNNNINFDICFYNEMNNPSYGWTTTSWNQFWSFYAPVVHSNGGTTSWCIATTNGFPDGMPFFPTNPFPDKIHFDWYANDFFQHGITPITYGLQAAADAHNIPLGIGEFGATNDAKKFNPNAAQWNSFCNDQIIGIFGATPTTSYPSGGRLAAGKSNTDLIYYSDVTNLSKPNAINGPTDFKIPGLQAIYDALNA